MTDNKEDELKNLADAIAGGVISMKKAKKLNLDNVKHVPSKQSFNNEFKEIDKLNLQGLRRQWRKLYNKPVPKFSRAVLEYKLKYRLQELMYGGFDSETKKLLKLAINKYVLNKPERPLIFSQYPVGTQITRTYKGIPHTIIILENGYFYDGTTYKNLSAIVARIVGTKHWSVQAFFGIK